jgi:hypothetical protein
MNIKKFKIKDWAGNELFDGQTFETFDDAEEALTEYFDSYDTADEYYEENRGEYEIVETEE